MQPVLPAFDPDFVCRCQVSRRSVQAACADFGFVRREVEETRAADGAEASALVDSDFAGGIEGNTRPDCEHGEDRAAFPPAIGAVAKADAQGFAAYLIAYASAKTLAGANGHGRSSHWFERR